MTWVLEHLQILIGAAAAIAYFLNRRNRTDEGEEDPKPAQPSTFTGGSEERDERTRRVQAEIRRKIAERRGESPVATDRPVARDQTPPPLKPSQVPPIDTFGGPGRRFVRKLEEAAAKFEHSAEDPSIRVREEEVARRIKTAEANRELDAARFAQEQYAAALAAAKKKKRESAIPRPPLPDNFRAALRKPADLRRAVVLREILGTPVGLR